MMGEMIMENKVTIFDHPLIAHKISILRDEKTGSKQFREIIEEIAMLMGTNCGPQNEGVWVYGDIRFQCIIPYIHNEIGKCPIDVDTIGQYTGLKDKNGKEIYEGDIVYSEFADASSCMFLVGWNNKLSCFGVMDEYDYQSKQLGYDFPEFDNHLFIEVLKHSKILKVIGNIHDNPELLKQEQI
jgi:uncharacterized phage protein (TIGR01671 family)